MLTPRYVAAATRAARTWPAVLSLTARELLPAAIAILALLLALALPVLLILWRLRRPYS